MQRGYTQEKHVVAWSDNRWQFSAPEKCSGWGEHDIHSVKRSPWCKQPEEKWPFSVVSSNTESNPRAFWMSWTSFDWQDNWTICSDAKQLLRVLLWGIPYAFCTPRYFYLNPDPEISGKGSAHNLPLCFPANKARVCPRSCHTRGALEVLCSKQLVIIEI